MKNIKIIITGFAGQGVLWLGKKIAEEILRRDSRKFVSFLAEYQAGIRTGESQAQVIVGNQPISCPFIDEADILIKLKDGKIKCGCEVIELKGKDRTNEIALKEIFKSLECQELLMIK